MQALIAKIFFLQDQIHEDTIFFQSYTKKKKILKITFKTHLLLIVSNIAMYYRLGSTNFNLTRLIC